MQRVSVLLQAIQFIKSLLIYKIQFVTIYKIHFVTIFFKLCIQTYRKDVGNSSKVTVNKTFPPISPNDKVIGRRTIIIVAYEKKYIIIGQIEAIKTADAEKIIQFSVTFLDDYMT